MRKNTVELVRPQMTIWRTRIACWIPKATNTHSEYVILIVFPLQQRSSERDPMLRHTYIDFYFNFMQPTVMKMTDILIETHSHVALLVTVC